MHGPLYVSAPFKWTAVTLILIVGLIHLIEMPEYFQIAAYLGVLFLANAAGAFVAAWGIAQQATWGWLLGVLVAGGAIIAYFVSRSIGLPGFPPAAWFESIDVLSLVVEAAFVVIAVIVFTMPQGAHDKSSGDTGSGRAAS